MTALVWFRQDLRVRDNPALVAAAAAGEVVPIFILDELSRWRPAGATRWWLHQSLASLRGQLGQLLLLRGAPHELLPAIVRQTGATSVFWNRCYEPDAVARDKGLKAHLQAFGVKVQSFNASLLHEPWDVTTRTGGPFKVFGAYWRACLEKPVEAPLPAPSLRIAQSQLVGDQLEDWDLLPRNPNWAAGWENIWQPGEDGALARLDEFIRDHLAGYSAGRDRPDLARTSKLSPHLHWGEISPRQIWSRVAFAREEPGKREGASKFSSEIGWREFAYHLLYHFQSLPEQNWRNDFDRYPWRDAPAHLKAWRQGLTGYPFVDAGMRELWRTGWMHNRARMVAASFLTKHLGIDWRRGEDWFWNTLVDADLANNASGWQWVAGTGADAAPYFRIFNPVTQGRKFDPDGHYIRRWCPELARLSNDDIHAPFEAPPTRLSEAGITLGKTYPLPIVDHAAARRAALAGYEKIRRSGSPASDDPDAR